MWQIRLFCLKTFTLQAPSPLFAFSFFLLSWYSAIFWWKNPKNKKKTRQGKNKWIIVGWVSEYSSMKNVFKSYPHIHLWKYKVKLYSITFYSTLSGSDAVRPSCVGRLSTSCMKTSNICVWIKRLTKCWLALCSEALQKLFFWNTPGCLPLLPLTWEEKWPTVFTKKERKASETTLFNSSEARYKTQSEENTDVSVRMLRCRL